jgi:hypothetical protein
MGTNGWRQQILSPRYRRQTLLPKHANNYHICLLIIQH